MQLIEVSLAAVLLLVSHAAAAQIKIEIKTSGPRAAYDDASPGVLEIAAGARIDPPELASELEWEIDPIGDVEAELDSPKGNPVTFRFRGLP